VIVHGNKESCEEGNKEDRKEEISSLYIHSICRLEEKFSSLLFAAFPDMKLHPARKIQANFVSY